MDRWQIGKLTHMWHLRVYCRSLRQCRSLLDLDLDLADDGFFVVDLDLFTKCLDHKIFYSFHTFKHLDA